MQFRVDMVDADWRLGADAQLLAFAVMNLLHNAFKNTPGGGQVVLRAHAEGARLLISWRSRTSVAASRRVTVMTSIATVTAEAAIAQGWVWDSLVRATPCMPHEGEIRPRNVVGKGCMFVIEVPLARGDVREIAH